MNAAIAWICSLLGLGVMYVFLLGNAMSTVPVKLTLGPALGLAVLPLVAAVAGALGFSQDYAARKNGPRMLLHIVPLLIAGASFVNITVALNPLWLQWLGEGGQSYTRTYESDGHEPFYALEIRLAQEEPASGFTEMTSDRVNGSVFVAEEVLFTNADVAKTWMQGPDPFQGYVIGIDLTPAASPRLTELSTQHEGRRWAILLDGELFVAPRIAEPLQETVVLQGAFNATAAGNYARGIMQRF